MSANLDFQTLSLNATHPSNPDLIQFDTHSIMGHMQALRTRDIMTDIFSSPTPDKRPFVLSSSTYAGSGAFTQHHSMGVRNQTWDYMRYSIASIMNFNMFGIPMTSAPICGMTDGTNYTKSD
jgi:alpha-glucosidase (family GH31 glycosyl hydrolase)